MSAAPTSVQARGEASFQARIASVALITTLTVLLAACAAFMGQQWLMAVRDSRTDHQLLARVLAVSAAPAAADHDRLAASRVLLAAATAEDITRVELRDRSGAVLAAFDTQREKADGRRAQRIEAPVLQGQLLVGRLILVARQPSFAALLPRFAALTGALFLAAMAAAIFLGQALAQRVCAPVGRMSRAMGEVAQSGRFEPIDEAAEDDVFRSLAGSFNALLAKLDANDRSLRAAMVDLVAARDSANEASVLKSQFLANMSHEIRTPLNGVLAMAQVMDLDALSEPQRNRLAIIRESGEVLLSVLNGVLDLSKIEAGKLELVDRDFDLSDLVRSLAQTYAPGAAAKMLAFDLSIADEAAGIWRGDPDRLRQILANLISNAIKFTETGSVSLRFALTASGALRAEVADTGIGIAPEQQLHLFEKFSQADASTTRRFGGTGLGLAICRELAQLMDGVVGLTSEAGVGSTFFLEVPLARAMAPAVEPEPVVAAQNPVADAPVAETADERRRLRILAAEDNPTNRMVLQSVLAPLDAELTLANDGAAAVEAWRRAEFDIVLMDIQMPVMDGLEATRAIRSEEAMHRRPRTPILALTANALVHQVEGYLAVGMDGHVAKPIQIAHLYASIETALNDAELRRNAA